MITGPSRGMSGFFNQALHLLGERLHAPLPPADDRQPVKGLKAIRTWRYTLLLVVATLGHTGTAGHDLSTRTLVSMCQG